MGFHTATDTPLIRADPVSPPTAAIGVLGLDGIWKGPDIRSKLMLSSFRISVLDSARLQCGEDKSIINGNSEGRTNRESPYAATCAPAIL